MRHSYLFAATSIVTLVLAGCDPDTSGGGYLNPATDVDLPLETFRLRDTEGLDSVLQYTTFQDLYRGMEPATEGNDNGSAMAIRNHLDNFLGTEPDSGGSDYISLRNPLDLINEVIRSGQVDNFNEGRRLMRDSIERDEAASFNTPANDALIRFTETGSEDSASQADSTWIYVMLDWTYNPAMKKVFRASQFVARQPAEDDENPAEVASAAWSGRFSSNTFGTTGFNQPEFSATSYTGRTLGNVELLQEFMETQRDTLTLTNASGIVINGDEPDCVKVIINYGETRARVFTSKDEPAMLEEGDARTRNPQHCGNQRSGDEAFIYTTINVEDRQ